MLISPMSSKIILTSIIGSVLLMSAIGFGLIMVVNPAILNPAETKNTVLQYVYQEFTQTAYIFDYNMTTTKINGTETSITTHGNSKLAIQFNALAIMSMTPTFTGRHSYYMMVVVHASNNDVIDNRTKSIHYFDADAATGSYRELSFDIHFSFVTSILQSDTYTVSVHWRSTWNAPGDNVISVNHKPNWNFIRTIFIQELKP